jgi:hypothetical protein
MPPQGPISELVAASGITPSQIETRRIPRSGRLGVMFDCVATTRDVPRPRH